MDDSSNFTPKDPTMTRRKVLGRLGTFAAIAYAVPAVTTLSMAQAGSKPGKSGGASKSGSPSKSGAPSKSGSPSNSNDDDDNNNGGSGGTDPAFKSCGREDLTDPTYLQCLKDNNFPLPK